ncbi:MAG: hypothetical protein MZW92_48580, partial [Comamonadaceae bacterium]|nr:hypothetical protein [Comamonadaceae bacterium]
MALAWGAVIVAPHRRRRSASRQRRASRPTARRRLGQAFAGPNGRCIAVRRIPLLSLMGRGRLLVAVANQSPSERGPEWVERECSDLPRSRPAAATASSTRRSQSPPPPSSIKRVARGRSNCAPWCRVDRPTAFIARMRVRRSALAARQIQPERCAKEVLKKVVGVFVLTLAIRN